MWCAMGFFRLSSYQWPLASGKLDRPVRSGGWAGFPKPPWYSETDAKCLSDLCYEHQFPFLI